MTHEVFELCSREVPACHRCGGQQYLTVSLPHASLPGRRIVGLCPSCDAADPPAQHLLAYMAIHGTVQAGDEAVFAGLLHAWVDQISMRVPDPDAQAADERAWRAGEL